MTNWRDYYGADSHLARSRHRTIGAPADQELAARLGSTPLGLLQAGVGTSFVPVVNVLVGESDENVDDIDFDRGHEWFAHGDPWSVLMGVSHDHVVVGAVELWASGMGGPAGIHVTWQCEPLPLAGLDLAELAGAVEQAHRITMAYWWTCPLCRSIRYGEGCTCDSLATGTLYC